MTRPRVCLIQTRIALGGPVWVTLGLARDLPSRGWDTLLVGGSPKRNEVPLEHLPQEMGVTYRKFPALSPYAFPPSDAVALFQLWRLMRRWRPDVVHTHSSKAGWVGRLAAFLAGVPVIVHTYHGHAFTGYTTGVVNRVFFTIERILGRLTDAHIALSPDQLDTFSRQCRVGPQEKFALIPLGLDVHRFQGGNSLAGRFRRELGIPSSVPLVGVVARLTPDKNVALFLEAAAQVAPQQDGATRYVVVGDGPLRGELERQTTTLGIAERVVFAGYRLDMDAVYADLDIAVLSSDNDGTPMSLLEAMACGKPVVATDVGGVRDTVPPGGGLLVPMRNPAAMASALQELLANPQKRRQMGEQARGAMERERSWDTMVDAHDALYRRLLAARAGAKTPMQPPSLAQ